MNTELTKLYPQKMWECFANICDIPHPSKHEEKILAWLKNWAKENKIDFEQDETGNLLFRKPATPGMENRIPIILQGHIDMVPQANSDVKHDFLKDPIKPVIDNGWVHANGTTLGADNGMGCAAAMAVLLSKDIAHGPVEVLVTVDEETGMTGAFGLKPGMVKGKILMNLDSETEGELYVGCAGGLDATFELPYRLVDTPETHIAYQIAITGLKGGHSGMDIILGRANANKVMIRLLRKLATKFGAQIADIKGGSLRNAIPREAFVTVTFNATREKRFLAYINEFADFVKKEFSATEPTFSIECSKVDTPAKVMDRNSRNKAINMVLAIPNGVMRMSDSMPNLVETSNNLAVVKTDGEKVIVLNLMRSSVESAKDALADKMCAIAEMAGAKIELTGGYPGWKPNLESTIFKTMSKVYREKFGKKPKVMAIHAGLECGLFGTCYPEWEMISFGPTILYPHSPDEKVNIDSVGKFWDFLVETLKNIPAE